MAVPSSFRLAPALDSRSVVAPDVSLYLGLLDFELPFRENLSEGSVLFVEYFFSTISLRTNRDAVAFRAALVVLQLSAALTLLTGAGLIMNSFIRLYHSSLGCDTSNLMTFQIRFPPERFANSQAEAACERIRERIAAIPGVGAVAFGEHAPFSESMPGPVPFTIEGRLSSGKVGQTAIRLAVSSAYFGVLKTPVVRGREFRREDTESKPSLFKTNT